jgi:hypothetical protein
MSKRLAAAGLAAGLVGGAAAGFALTVPGGSGAASTTATTATTVAPSGTVSPAETAKTDWIARARAPLVANKTITQAQADAVTKALAAARPRGRGGGGERGGPFGRGVRGPLLATAAKAIGITTDQLRTAVEGGQSIAAVAKAKGVDPQKVIDALVAEVKTRAAAEVAKGDATQAEANTAIARATIRITAIVNGTLPLRPAKRHPTTTTS